MEAMRKREGRWGERIVGGAGCDMGRDADADRWTTWQGTGGCAGRCVRGQGSTPRVTRPLVAAQSRRVPTREEGGERGERGE